MKVREAEKEGNVASLQLVVIKYGCTSKISRVQ
jgi:hypothetical protein